MDVGHFFGNTLRLTKIPPHIPTIILSFAAFTFIHLVLAPWICSTWFPESYGSKKSRIAKNNWATHVVSQAHSIIIVTAASYAVLTETPDIKLDKMYGWNDSIGFAHSIAVGYFIWDSLDAIFNYVDFGFIVHGIACTLVFGLSYRPFAAYYGVRCLLWEISTFFLNIQWFLDKTGNTGTKIQLINGIFLLFSFFCVRLIYGGSISIHFIFTLAKEWHDVPWFYIIVYGGANCILQGLNIFWFIKMISALYKRFK